VQFGGIGAFEGSQESVARYREELAARRDLFYAGIREHAGAVFSGAPPRGAFYAFLKIDKDWRAGKPPASGSISWAMTELLISRARIGCIPGIDFGANGEGYVRFCFARDRRELTGALESMRSLFNAEQL
jgi:aspartate/methionine/tyrosine aminotransferase